MYEFTKFTALYIYLFTSTIIMVITSGMSQCLDVSKLIWYQSVCKMCNYVCNG